MKHTSLRAKDAVPNKQPMESLFQKMVMKFHFFVLSIGLMMIMVKWGLVK